MGLTRYLARAPESDFMHDQRGEQRGHVRIVVIHRQLEGAERHFSRRRGADAGDDVGHVMRHIEMVERGTLHTRHRKAVTGVELEELPTQRALGQMLQREEQFDQFGLGLGCRNGQVSKCRLEPQWHGGIEEAGEIGGRPFRSDLHQIAEHGHLGTGHRQGLAVLLSPLELFDSEGMSAGLEGNEDLMEGASLGGINDRRGRAGGVEGVRRVQIQIRLIPKMRGDRSEHAELFVGGAAADVDSPQQSGHHGFHPFWSKSQRHAPNSTH